MTITSQSLTGRNLRRGSHFLVSNFSSVNDVLNWREAFPPAVMVRSDARRVTATVDTFLEKSDHEAKEFGRKKSQRGKIAATIYFLCGRAQAFRSGQV